MKAKAKPTVTWQVREIHLRPRDDESWDAEFDEKTALDAAERFAEEVFGYEIRCANDMDFSRTVEVRQLSYSGRKTKIQRVNVFASFDISWNTELLK